MHIRWSYARKLWEVQEFIAHEFTLVRLFLDCYRFILEKRESFPSERAREDATAIENALTALGRATKRLGEGDRGPVGRQLATAVGLILLAALYVLGVVQWGASSG